MIKKKRKLLRPQDRLLLVLAGMGDVLSFLHEEVGIGKTSFRDLYGWTAPKYKKSSFRALIYRILRVGYIEKIIKDDEVYFRLTGIGEKVIVRDFPLVALQKRKWDGQWRVVMFDIEEINKRQRDFLRRKLRELGFCLFQKSVYISPLDVAGDLKEFLEEQGLRKQVVIMETRIPSENSRILAEKLWKIGKFNERYEILLEDLEEIERQFRKSDLSEETARERLKQTKTRYLEILSRDPFLPKELLPVNWLREELKLKILEVEKLLKVKKRREKKERLLDF